MVGQGCHYLYVNKGVTKISGIGKIIRTKGRKCSAIESFLDLTLIVLVVWSMYFGPGPLVLI